MGNCQAVDAAALVIQHPNGKQERMYWSITASEVMKMNPGHYVSLIIPLPSPFHDDDDDDQDQQQQQKSVSVRYSRVKLLRPTDTLLLGRAYRLLTTQEVIRAKKQGRTQAESDENEKKHQARQNQRSGATNVGAKSSLQSISELGSSRTIPFPCIAIS